MSEAREWIDAGTPGVRFALARYQGVASAEGEFLCVYCPDGYPLETRTALAALGFRPSSENPNLLARSGLDWSIDEIKSAFPSARKSMQADIVSAVRVVPKAAPFAPPPLANPVPPAPVVPASEPRSEAAAPLRRPMRPGPIRLSVEPAVASSVVVPSEAAAPTSPVSAKPADVDEPVRMEAPKSESPNLEVPKADAAMPVQAPVSASPRRVGVPLARPDVAKPMPVDIPKSAPLEFPGQINPFQMLYRPGSKIGKPIAAIPINLATPTEKALERVRRKYGDIDEFVADRLKWTVEEMAGYLSPEQVDAVALAIHSSERGQGFVIADATGLGKGRSQPLDSLLLTLRGWTRMGDIKVGDEVYSVDGKLTKVLKLHPQGVLPVYKVTFQDGSSTRASGDHLWAVKTRCGRYNARNYPWRPMGDWRFLTTDQIRSSIHATYSIPMMTAFEYPHRDVLIDPYLVGALLGDSGIGRNSTDMIIAEKQMTELVEADLSAGIVVKPRHAWATHVNLFRSTGNWGPQERSLPSMLKKIGIGGCRAWEKFVPVDYKWNSVGVRHAVLQGLLDTDGIIQPDGSVICTTISPELRDDVVFLVRSLGGLTTVGEKPTYRGLAYNVNVRLPDEFPPFRLSRKAEGVKARVKYPLTRYIKSVELVGEEPCQCITVADPTHLYVTDDFIVTHNCVAAITRAGVLSGKPVVFVTEKENLFSDLWRDIVDIGSADLIGRPFMLNDGAQIVDGSSADAPVVHAAWKKKDVLDAIKAKALPKGVKLMMAAYSQFNRPGSAKTEFLKAVAKGNTLLCDESHNAVGDSQTSLALAEAMDGAASVVYSSATFARHAANLAAYKRLFPASMQSSDLMDVLAAGGQSISEALSQMLAEDGAYLRREHDLSDLSIEVLDDVARLPRNREFADALSPILGRVAKLSRQVTLIVDERNSPNGGGEDGAPRKGGKEFWTAGNFGSRLGLIVRQFVTALLVDPCIEQSIAALKAGRKPVIVIESTMESLMRELSADRPSPDGEEQDDQAVIEAIESSEEATDGAEGPNAIQGKPPTFRDALRLLVDRTMQVSVRKGKEDPEKVPVDDPVLVAEAESLRLAIEGFPDLPLSPIDDVRSGIEEASRRMVEAGEIEKPWAVGEISARSMRVVGNAYEQMPPQDRVGTVARFQAGNTDAIVLTRAASTGLSLHASEKVKDQRPRQMFELQIPSNVVERVQFWGRVKRRGQVCEPFFTTLSTALPLQVRNLAIQNRKVADLSANVTASAESANAMKVPDIIDPIGNEVCKRFLNDNQRLADAMHIPLRLKDMETAEAEFYHVNKLLQRLVLLSSSEQDRVFREIVAAYEDRVREMKARGQSPRGARELPGVWRLIERDVFEPGDPRDGDVFGRAVTLSVVETTRDLDPIRSDAVKNMIASATRRLATSKGATPEEPFGVQMRHLQAKRSEYLTRFLTKDYMNWQQAAKDGRPNPVRSADDRLQGLMRQIAFIRPGCPLSVNGEDGADTGVVVDVRAPYDPDSAFQPGRWTVKYVCPGDEKPREISLAPFVGSSVAQASPAPESLPVLLARRFDAAPRGPTPERRSLLDGNLVRAVIAARNAGWGSMASWRDENGRLSRAILVPKSYRANLDSALGGRTASIAAAMTVLSAGGHLWTNPDKPDAGARIEIVDGHVHVDVPGDKRLSKPFESEALKALLGEWRGAGTTRWSDAHVSRAEKVLVALAKAGHVFHYDGRHRKAVNAALEKSGEAVMTEELEGEADSPRM